MVRKLLAAFLPLLLLIAIPFWLRPREEVKGPAPAGADKLVIITAHNESIRHEYEQAFKRYYRERTGRDVELDFRAPGGTSDIMRYIADRYTAEFRHAFESDPANGEWTSAIAAGFADPRSDSDPSTPAEVRRARELFLKSDVGIGIDLMAGGGTFDQARNASRGYAVDGGLQQRHPEYFKEEIIPGSFGGDRLYDERGRFYGVVLSTFGICYSADRIAELSPPEPPRAWRDLGDGRFFNTLILADPTKSGSANKCFEIVIQQAMAESGGPDAGWVDGLNLLKRIFANARTLSDSAGRVVREVAAGNAAAGMAIDTYGFTEQEWNEFQFEGPPRFFYVAPEGGTAVSADPVQLLRGAPHREVAEVFLDFLLSEEGQKLHCFRTGTPDGPERSALRRPAIRRDLYREEFRQYKSDPDYDPYKSGASFVYHAEWTGPYYNLLRTLLKCIMLEPQPELQRAWRAILDAGGPEKVPQAMAAFNRLPFSYQEAAEAARKIQPGAEWTAVDVAALCRAWSDEARRNYLEAEALARAGEGGERR